MKNEITKQLIFGEKSALDIIGLKKEIDKTRSVPTPLVSRQVLDYIHSMDLVNGIDDLSTDQVLRITNLTPVEFEGGSRVRFLKRGEQAILKDYSGFYLAEKKVTPFMLYEDALSELEADKLYRGIGYHNTSSRQKTNLSLDQLIKGHMLFAYSKQSKRTNIEVKNGFTRNISDTIRSGGKYIVEVPAMDAKNKGKEREDFTIEGVPVFSSKSRSRELQKGDAAYRLGLSLSSHHACEIVKYSISFANKSSTTVCAHTIAASDAVISYEAERGNSIPYILNAFPVMTQKMLDFYKKLKNNVVVENVDVKGRMKMLPLDWSEREMLLFEYIKKEGFAACFDRETNPDIMDSLGNFRKPRLREYNIHPEEFPSMLKGQQSLGLVLGKNDPLSQSKA